MKDPILLVGAGPMAVAYAQVFKAMEIPFTAVGRGESSAAAFEKETGSPIKRGGLEAYAQANSKFPARAVVAVSELALGESTATLLEKGVKDILVEKPGAATTQEISKIAELAAQKKANVRVGYNRRFYASTLAAQKLIQAEGGVSSFNFEFTEWGHVVSKKECPQGVKDGWFLHNSTHVVDLAFYLGGKPEKISAYTGGKLDWRSGPSKYAGAGVTKDGALFSYHANWGAPGRWSVEILTAKNRYYFKPVEKLQAQKLGSVAIEEVSIDDSLDKTFKPGLYRQVEAFLNGNSSLPNILEQAANALVYRQIEP